MIKKCATCRMELLPYEDEDGRHPAPTLFCDDSCERMFKMYSGVFVDKKKRGIM